MAVKSGGRGGKGGRSAGFMRGRGGVAGGHAGGGLRTAFTRNEVPLPFWQNPVGIPFAGPLQGPGGFGDTFSIGQTPTAGGSVPGSILGSPLGSIQSAPGGSSSGGSRVRPLRQEGPVSSLGPPKDRGIDLIPRKFADEDIIPIVPADVQARPKNAIIAVGIGALLLWLIFRA